jgi:hypothetical protein
MIQEALEAYTWRAIYDDDRTAVYENIHNSFADVDQARVKTVLLVPLTEGRAPHRLDIPQGAQALFFRRRRVELNPHDEQIQTLPPVHCIGWKKNTQAIYLFVFENGSTLLTENLQAV